MDYRGVLVGLGNPGPKYERTRHNTGFLLVDKILDLAHLEGRVEDMNGARFDCELWRVTLDALDGTWLVAKPMTFMNLSGRCVQPLLAWHKLGAADLVVAHDELDLPPGSLRFKFGGGNAGHNGLKSIIAAHGPDFIRVYVGIGRPEEGTAVIDHVLTRFNDSDRALVDQAEERAAEAVLRLAGGERFESVVQWANSL